MSQQQNNRNQGGGLSRYSRSNQNQQQQNNQNNNPFSRGSSSSSSSRFGNNRQNNNQNNQNNRSNSPPRFGNLPSRFGSSEMGWYIEPLESTFVRFDLDGLGDPFHRILGETLNLEYSDQEKLMDAFDKGGDVVDRLMKQMEEAWETYDLTGAVIIYPWRDAIKQVIAANPVSANTGNDDSDDDDDNSNNQNNNNAVTPLTASQCLRSIDLLLVLNILARTRADLLLSNAPLALESGFLNRSLVTNDPRLVALARATGCVEEHFS